MDIVPIDISSDEGTNPVNKNQQEGRPLFIDIIQSSVIDIPLRVGNSLASPINQVGSIGSIHNNAIKADENEVDEIIMNTGLHRLLEKMKLKIIRGDGTIDSAFVKRIEALCD